MIEFKTKNVSRETILFLQNLEKDILETGKVLINQKDFSSFTVSYKLYLNKVSKKERPYKVSSNASMEIEKSLIFQNIIFDYIAKREVELNSFLKSSEQFVIELIFNKKEKTTSSEQAETSKELPYFTPIFPRYSFNRIILPTELRQQIYDSINIIKYQKLIYKDWGFEEVDTIPKSILNFYGPPGTGKTMCAHAIAKEVDKKLLALNYAEIESKYVGEAPKNLQRAFDIAKEEDCVLFFDEADSFLGKRINNVTQGAEQALNSLRSQMLILLEEFPGIVIFATNLVSNFDRAFESRILKHLKFNLPNREARIEIIRHMLPKKLPLQNGISEELLLKLSESSDGFSGREIKNAILNILLAKASVCGNNAIFTDEDLISGFIHQKEELEQLKKAKENSKIEKIKRAITENRVKEAKEEKKVNVTTENSQETPLRYSEEEK